MTPHLVSHTPGTRHKSSILLSPSVEKQPAPSILPVQPSPIPPQPTRRPGRPDISVFDDHLLVVVEVNGSIPEDAENIKFLEDKLVELFEFGRNLKADRKRRDVSSGEQDIQISVSNLIFIVYSKRYLFDYSRREIMQ